MTPTDKETKLCARISDLRLRLCRSPVRTSTPGRLHEFTDTAQHGVDESGGECRPGLSRSDDARPVRRRRGRQVPLRQLLVDAAPAVPDHVRTPRLSTVRRRTVRRSQRQRVGPLSGQRGRLRQHHPRFCEYFSSAVRIFEIFEYLPSPFLLI